MRRSGASIVAAICLLPAFVSCSGTRPPSPFASADTKSRSTTLLTIGGSATEGDGLPDRYRDAWPYLLYQHAFPPSTSLVNTALDGATTANTIIDQLPLAQQVKPDTVAIWLGADDLAQRTPIDQFATELHVLIDDLHNTGAHRILVADLPDVFGPNAAAYNAAIQQVVTATNARLVELQHAPITLAPSGGAGPQPDTEGHRVIANAFQHELETSP
jgi:lysophospholipase L1-like esterase